MQNPVLNSKKKGDAADRILNPSADKHKMKTSLDKGTQRKTTENELPSLTQCTA